MTFVFALFLLSGFSSTLSIELDWSFRGLTTREFFVTMQKSGNSEEVTVLNLRGNLFDRFLDCSAKFNNLRILDLSLNNLEKIFILCSDEQNLQYLNLSHNRLRAIEDEYVNESLTKLKTLDLSSNMISGLNDTMFDHMRVLDHLSLANNPMNDGIVESTFWSLRALTKLNLRNVSMTWFSPVMFETLTNLTDLDISLNPIEEIPAMPISLERLDLSGTHLIQLSYLFLPHLKSLRLDLMPKLESALLNDFENTTSLEDLSISGCSKLTTLKLEKHHDNLLPQLRHLSVKNGALETLAPELQPLLERITVLELQNNPWACDCRIKWFHNMNVTGDIQHAIRCMWPSEHRAKILVHIPEHELQCQKSGSTVFEIVWICIVVLVITFVITALAFLFKDSLAKLPVVRKRSGNTISYANVVESSNDLVRILPDGDNSHNIDE